MWIPSINDLPQMFWKGMTIQETEQEGQTTNLMESGVSATLFMYHDERYVLTIQYQTKDQIKTIKNELLEAVKTENGKVTLNMQKCQTAGYFNLQDLTVDPTFTLVDKIKVSRVSGTDYWNLSITLLERIEAVI